MPTLVLPRKVQPTRRLAAAMSATLVQAIMALCFALVVAAVVTHPGTDDPDSAIFSVAGP